MTNSRGHVAPVGRSGAIDRLRPYLTVRDVPLWLAGVAFAWLIADGLIETLANPAVAIVVLVVVGVPLLLVVAGRRLVRRRPYSRRFRLLVALVALFAIFALPVQLAFVSFSFLPAALALLAVELAARPPVRPNQKAPAAGEPLPPAPRAGGAGVARPDRPRATERQPSAERPASRPANEDGFDWPEDEPPPQRSLVGRLRGRR